MKNSPLLKIEHLSLAQDQREILHDVNLEIAENKTVVVLGKNGAGKSTLCRSIAMQKKDVKIQGKIIFKNKNIIKSKTNDRATEGIFISYQEPIAIPGLSLSELLRSALEAHGIKMSLGNFKLELAKNLTKLELSPFLAERDFNVGFSGGEKKKIEILQILMLKPKLILLDEIDSGLDINAAQKMSKILADFQKENHASFVVVTHNMRILKHLRIDQTVLMENGRITKIGGEKLLSKIKQNGF